MLKPTASRFRLVNFQRRSHSFLSSGHGQPCLLNALGGDGVDGGGIFKADEVAARVQRGHGGCAGASADVRHHLAGACVGADQVLAQGHGLLRGMYGGCHRGERQHVPRKAPPIGLTAGAFKLSVVGAVPAATVNFLVRLALFKLWEIGRGLLVEHQNVLRLFQRSAAGVEKTRAAAFVPYPLIVIDNLLYLYRYNCGDTLQ